MQDAEDCTICTERLGLVDRPAVQLPCGHAFCKECVDEWQRAKHSDCPQCRAEFQVSRIRALWPWKFGLRLKEQTDKEKLAVMQLDEMRAQRKAMEARVAAAERALKQMQAGAIGGRMTGEAMGTTTSTVVAPAMGPLHTDNPASSVAGNSNTVAAALTAEQQQRMAANRSAALERKRRREEANATLTLR